MSWNDSAYSAGVRRGDRVQQRVGEADVRRGAEQVLDASTSASIAAQIGVADEVPPIVIQPSEPLPNNCAVDRHRARELVGLRRDVWQRAAGRRAAEAGRGVVRAEARRPTLIGEVERGPRRRCSRRSSRWCNQRSRAAGSRAPSAASSVPPRTSRSHRHRRPSRRRRSRRSRRSSPDPRPGSWCRRRRARTAGSPGPRPTAGSGRSGAERNGPRCRCRRRCRRRRSAPSGPGPRPAGRCSPQPAGRLDRRAAGPARSRPQLDVMIWSVSSLTIWAYSSRLPALVLGAS